MEDITSVLVIAQALIPSVLLGVIKPLEILQAKNLITFSFVESHQVTPSHLVRSDVIICVRGCSFFELNIVKASKKRNRYVIYFLDDDLLNVPNTANSSEYFSLSKIKENIIRILKQSDIIMTPSINIGTKYGSYCPDVRVTKVPALLLEVTDERSYKKKSEYDPVIIGFSGGIDHANTVEKYLREPIEQIQKEFKDKVRFEVMGPRPSILDELHIGYIPYEADHNVYMSKLKSLEWDIGLAPLTGSDFHACKFYNKYLEYGAIGAAGIYSKVEPFTQIIKNDVNGILVENNTEAWVNALRRMITEQSTRLAIADSAYKHVKTNFCLESITSQIIEEIPELGTYCAPVASEKDFRIGVIKNPLIRKLVNFLKNHGYKAPIEFIKKMINKFRVVK